MENILFLGVPILKHIRVGVGGSVTFCQVFWFSCGCGSVQAGKTSLPKQLLSFIHLKHTPLTRTPFLRWV